MRRRPHRRERFRRPVWHKKGAFRLFLSLMPQTFSHDLRQRGLSSLVSELPTDSSTRIDSLDARGNRLCDLSSLTGWKGLSTLKELHLSRNRIVSYALINGPSLDYLDVAENFITDRQFSGCRASQLPLLRHLRLSGNSLTTFPLNGSFPFLRVLDLHGNNISALVSKYPTRAFNYSENAM